MPALTGFIEVTQPNVGSVLVNLAHLEAVVEQGGTVYLLGVGPATPGLDVTESYAEIYALIEGAT